MSRNELRWKAADARRRIHIQGGDKPTYSFGATGARFRAATPGDALNEAIAQVGDEPLVIIYETTAR